MLGLEGEAPGKRRCDPHQTNGSPTSAPKSLSLMGRHPSSVRRRPSIWCSIASAACRTTRTGCALHPWIRTGAGFTQRSTTRSEEASWSTKPRPGRTGSSPITPSLRTPSPRATELLQLCAETGLRISDVMLANEQAWRIEAEVRAGSWRSGRSCRTACGRGCERDGILPGGLKVKRRARTLHAKLRPSGNALWSIRSDHGLGQSVRTGGQRGERGRRPGRHRADQRRGRHHSGGAALLRPVRAGRRR